MNAAAPVQARKIFDGTQIACSFLSLGGAAVKTGQRVELETPVGSEDTSESGHEREVLAFIRVRPFDHEPCRVRSGIAVAADHRSVSEIDLPVVAGCGIQIVLQRLLSRLFRDNEFWSDVRSGGLERYDDPPLTPLTCGPSCWELPHE